ncbi:MAG: ABC-type transport auxiliary lipoprotein family protein [Deltaproteobacteria bacterium]|nr:ABC-type transport auxiliary lipoprotein family protein [Deltaproteobacteria bacterium]
MPKPACHRSVIPSLVTTVCLLISLLLWCGCGKPPMLVQQYLLDYPAPPVKAAPLADSLKVEPFAVGQAFNTTAMVYRTDPYKSETYNYSRWRVNPGYLVADYLTRDLRNARIFKAVLSTDSPTKARFALEGGVEEMQEIDQGEIWQASLALNITLLDTSENEITRRVLFQKKYQAAEPLTEKTPGGLAQAMSRAMEQLSARIITDIYQAAKKVSSK